MSIHLRYKRYTTIALLVVRMIALLWFSGTLSASLLVGQQSAPATENIYILNDTHYPGSLITVVLNELTPLTEMDVSLRGNAGEINVLTKGFAYQLNPQSRIWVALLGIPNYARAEAMTLEIASRGLFYANSHTRTIHVQDREFVRERIALNRALTTIRAVPDPRKEDEAREIFRLLTTVNQSVFYHSDALAVPTSSRRVTSGYGDRRIYEYSDGSEGYGIHFGIDYGGVRGTQITAAASGRVAMAKSRIITGNSVVIEHLPGIYTSYYHLDEIVVKVGQIVNVGSTIGSLGSSGLSTGPHLHWELRAAGVAIDPSQFFSTPLLDKKRINELISESL